MRSPKIKTQYKQKNQTIQRLLIVPMLGLLLLGSAAPVFADSYDDQIKALQQQIDGYQSQQQELQAQAATLQSTIAELSAKENALQAQIDQSEVKIEQLQAQIMDTQNRIAAQKQAIATNLRSMYIEADVTPLEVIASSKSIGDYVDKQAYRDSIGSSIQTALDQVKSLQTQLQGEQASAKQELANQQAEQNNLAVEQEQQSQLLADTQGQESAFQSLISQKNSQITTLRAEQAAANLKWSGGNVNFQNGGGGYPSLVQRSWGTWGSSVPLDNAADDWQMFNRECVSYAAFRVAASGRQDVPTGFGNAADWPGAARAHGIPVSSAPKAGDVAIWPVGYYGHAMYVEAVNADGSILISEYNYDWTGRYSSRTVSQSVYEAQGFQFIHF